MTCKRRIYMLVLCLVLSACNGAEVGSEAVVVESPAATPEATELEPTAPAPTRVEPTPAATTAVPAVTPAVETAQVPTATPPPPGEEPGAASDGRADADVIFVRARKTAAQTWTFSVTVAHPDTGWDDYADGWDVVLPDSTIVRPIPADPFTRLLLHPHENEQPFTRSQSNIFIPEGVTAVTVRAHDIVNGYGGREVMVDLASKSGPDYEVER